LRLMLYSLAKISELYYRISACDTIIDRQFHYLHIDIFFSGRYPKFIQNIVDSYKKQDKYFDK
jgi:hypothetical protein